MNRTTEARFVRTALSVALVGALAIPLTAPASSHREAPAITKMPKLDGTDLYAFKSYEPGRSGYVTLIANYVPLQDSYGGPNYFTMEPDGYYDINIDSNGDARRNITYRFRFNYTINDIALDVGGSSVSIPLRNAGQISAGNTGALNDAETYTVEVLRGFVISANPHYVTNAADGSHVFVKPVDNIGFKSIPDYATYAAAHVYNVNLPGCATPGTPFRRPAPRRLRGQPRRDLRPRQHSGRARDRQPLGIIERVGRQERHLARDGGADRVRHTGQRIRDRRLDDVIDGEAGRDQRRTLIDNVGVQQVSRLGMPLVNEIVIGLKDKDRFNASEPKDDGQFATYVTNPTLPALLEILFGSAGVQAPTVFPRVDLIAAFLTGVAGVNQPHNVVPSEMLRLNTALPSTPKGSQNSLGALDCFVDGALTLGNPGCDPAGFPNGRRPGDDVVDIELRVAMGTLLPPGPGKPASANLPYTDGALVEDSQFDATFPYLTTPLPGSPNGENGLPPNPPQ